MAVDIFSFSKSKPINLEEALNGIIHDYRLTFPFKDWQGDSISTPANILPVRFGENSLEGAFINEGLVRYSVGFFDIDKEAYYWYSSKSGLSKQDRNNSSLYLPVNFSDSYIILDTENNGQSTPNNGLYATFGIVNEDQNWPLILMYLDDQSNHRFIGLYYDPREKMIQSYCLLDDLYNKQMAELFFLDIYISHITSVGDNVASNKVINPIEKKTVPPTAKEKMDCSSIESIVEELKKDVKGQDEALYSVAESLYLFMQQVENPGVRLPLGHNLFMGSSGVGKTTTARVFAHKAGLPFVLTSAGDTSAPGYVGVSFTSVLDSIASQTDEYSPFGIVVIDECDKLVDDEQSSNNFFARRKQEMLLGWMDGVEVAVNKNGKPYRMSTENLLFICLGAFEGFGGDALARIISKRIGGSLEKEVSGFGRSVSAPSIRENIFKEIIPEDLIKYGFREELVGRLSYITVFNQLTLEDKVDILRNSNSSVIKRYENLFRLKGYTLKIYPETYRVIASKSPVKTGARGLVSISRKVFSEIVRNPQSYADANREIIITPEKAEKLFQKR